MGKKKDRDRKVHELREAERPTVPALRWIVPRTGGIPFAHALIGDAAGTLCGGHASNGAVYPPHPDVPKCPACTSALAKRAELAEKAEVRSAE